MIDSKGYRLNVGIILCNKNGRLFWARRAGMDSWQFPQGGIKKHEDSAKAMFRELHEETGLGSRHVEVIGRTKTWLYYDLPERFIRKHSTPLCIGQKQIWYILRLTSSDSKVRFDCSEKPEFDAWCWVDYWYPLTDVVFFKRPVYQKALAELGRFLRPNSVRVCPDGFLTKKQEYVGRIHS